MISTFEPGKNQPVVSTTGNRIEGVWLGNVEARIELDDEPLYYCGNQEQLARFYRAKDAAYRKQYAWRFGTHPDAAEIAADPYGAHHRCSLVRKIELVGPESEKQHIAVDGYTIIWEGDGPIGFGRIILGEIHVKSNDRQLTMVRLAMGSDAGGNGTAGDGKSNGQGTTG